MRAIKFKPVIIAFSSCLLLCTAVWFGYRYYGVQKPIDTQLQSATNSTVQIYISNSQQQLNLDVALKDGATLESAISELQTIIQHSKFMSYKISYNVQSSSSLELDQVWSNSLFGMADMMANKNYALIPGFLEQLTASNEGLEAASAIDDHYVYITLSKDQAVKHILLPLQAASMEVWNHA